MYALCVSGAVNMQGFVWNFFYALYKYINFHSFIHSFIHSFAKFPVSISTGEVPGQQPRLSHSSLHIYTHRGPRFLVSSKGNDGN